MVLGVASNMYMQQSMQYQPAFHLSSVHFSILLSKSGMPGEFPPVGLLLSSSWRQMKQPSGGESAFHANSSAASGQPSHFAA